MPSERANGSASENDSTRAAGDTARGCKQQPKADGTIRRLFRQTAKALAGREEAPSPAKKSGRRKGDDTGRRFIRTAQRLTRLRAHRLTALPWLADTLDWFNLWQPGGTELTDDLSQSAPNNHLSPRF